MRRTIHFYHKIHLLILNAAALGLIVINAYNTYRRHYSTQTYSHHPVSAFQARKYNTKVAIMLTILKFLKFHCDRHILVFYSRSNIQWLMTIRNVKKYRQNHTSIDMLPTNCATYHSISAFISDYNTIYPQSIVYYSPPNLVRS